jgi:hypothetical protein
MEQESLMNYIGKYYKLVRAHITPETRRQIQIGIQIILPLQSKLYISYK